MSQPTTRKYPAEFKERAVKLAVESEQPIAQTVRDLGVNENRYIRGSGNITALSARRRRARTNICMRN
jgi:transposase-like protein